MDTAHACSDARHGTDPGAELLRLQRLWRERLLGGAGATRWRPGREIAAELLLHLDDEAACWHRAADWLRDLLDADRVDGGPGGFVDPAEGHCSYQPQAEIQREPGLLPTVLGLRFEATDPGLQAVWQRPEPCWSSATCQQLGHWAAQALGPLLAEARHLNALARPPALPTLTPAELRVARLVARGLSYKEIARQLDRSVATIDHQTRRLREKFGVHSNARLMPLLDRLA